MVSDNIQSERMLVRDNEILDDVEPWGEKKESNGSPGYIGRVELFLRKTAHQLFLCQLSRATCSYFVPHHHTCKIHYSGFLCDEADPNYPRKMLSTGLCRREELGKGSRYRDSSRRTIYPFQMGSHVRIRVS